MSKKILALFLACMMSVTAFTGCSDDDFSEENSSSNVQQSIEGEDDDGNSGDVCDNDIANHEVDYSNFDDEFHTVDGNCSGIGVNQVMSFGVDQETGDAYYMNTFVEKKNTVFFAYLKEDEELDPTGATQNLKIYKDGELFANLAPDTGNITNSKRIAFAMLNDKCKTLTAGNYELVVTTKSGSATRNITLRSVPKMTILAVPIICNYGGEIRVPDESWKQMGSYTGECFPLSYDDFEYVLGNPLDLSGDEYDFLDEGCWYNIWEAVANLQTNDDRYTMIVGFSSGGMGPEQRTNGFTWGMPANIVDITTPSAETTVAHEIAHCYMVGDEYNGGSMSFNSNIAPLGFSGSNMEDRSEILVGDKEFIQTGRNYGDTQGTGSPIFPWQEPYNWARMFTWDDTNRMASSWMGNSGCLTDDYWITSAIWEQIYSRLTGADEETVSSGNTSCENPSCPYCGEVLDVPACNWWATCCECGSYNETAGEETFECCECGATNELTNEILSVQCSNENCNIAIPYKKIISQGCGQVSSQSSFENIPEGTDEEFTVIDIFGKINQNGFEAKPFYSYDGDNSFLTATNLNGDYSIQMLDDKNNVVNRLQISPEFFTNTNPPRELDAAPVDVTMKLPENTASINFLYKDEVITTISVSENAPEVEFTNKFPTEFDGEMTLEFKGSDADNDELHYEIWYQDYEDEVTFIASDITENKITVNSDDLAGTDAGYFVIYATDGVNTSYNFSDDFSVAYKAPEILEHDELPEYKLTDEIVIDLDIYDMQDGWLYEDDEVVWLDEKGNEVQNSSMLYFFPYELKPNTYTYTCIATNSAGISTEKEVTFVVSDEDNLLPDAWYTDAIEYTLSCGYVLPFENAEKTALTRLELATGLFMLEAYYADDLEVIDYEEDVVLDVPENLDQYSAFYAVKNGYMTTQNGEFSPFAPVTEKETMEAIYKVLEKTIPDYTSEYENSEDFYVDYAVLNDIDENTYSPDENTSKAKMFYIFYSLISLLE